MNLGKISIAAIFLTASFSTVYAQQDSIKNEKKIEGVIIRGNTKKSDESNLINIQKNSREIAENVGAAQLEKQGISDVASAVTKATGVSKQEGSSNVFVRGLGDRYNSTTLNKLPLPSNNPLKKNIDLDIFTIDVVEYIGIEKVYHPRNFGDFAGANVDINSKEYRGKKFFGISLGTGINTNAISNDNFHMEPFSYFGFYNKTYPKNGLTSYGFTNSLKIQETKNPFSTNFGLSFGNTVRNAGREGSLSYFVTSNFDNGYDYDERIIASSDKLGNYSRNFYDNQVSTYSTNFSLLGTLNYRHNSKHNIGFTFLGINSSSQRLGIYNGDYSLDVVDSRTIRHDYLKNSIMTSQVYGSSKLLERLTLEYSGAYNLVKSDMPDRRQFVLNRQADETYTVNQNSTAQNNRYWQNLTEEEYSGRVGLAYDFAKNEEDRYKGKFTVGYEGRMRDRKFQAFQYNYNLTTEARTIAVDPNNLDLFFNEANFRNGLYRLETRRGSNLNSTETYNPEMYRADQTINGAYATLEYEFSPKFLAILGFRYDRINQYLFYDTNQLKSYNDINPDFKNVGIYGINKYLPSLSLKYSPTDKQNFRFATSKTYTLPQFIEVAPFLFEDLDGNVFGNPFIYPTTNYNADLKWEMFPKRGELLSLGVFGKYILDPINRISVASAANEDSYVNSGKDAQVFGAELDFRKALVTFEDDRNNISAGLNFTYMHTKQNLDSDKIADETKNYINVNFTDAESRLQGASPFLANADITYNKSWNDNSNTFSATLSGNYNSGSIYSIGTQGRASTEEKPLFLLDFIVRTSFNKNFGVNFTAKNLLNTTFERIQPTDNGDRTILKYKRGMDLGLGVNYTF